MNPPLPMENGPRCDIETSVAHTVQPSAKSLKHNAFSIRSDGKVCRDRSLSTLSYAPAPRRTQLVAVEGVGTGCSAHFNALSDSQITNFNILVGSKIGIARLRMPILGERHG